MNEYITTWGLTFSTLWYWLPTHIHDARRGPEIIVDYWGFGSIFIYRMVEIENDSDDFEDFTA